MFNTEQNEFENDCCIQSTNRKNEFKDEYENQVNDLAGKN